MKIRFAHTLALLAGFTALPPIAMAVLPTTPPKVNPLAGQQKAVHDAQVRLEEARKQILVIRRRVEASFAAKPEYKAAKDAMEKAKNDYDAESRKVATSLEKDPAYAAEKTKRDKAQAVIDQAHAPPVANASGDDPVKLTDEEINTAVKDHQDAALAMMALQKHAQENDTNYSTLQQHRNEANTAWEAVQAQVDDALKADPAYPPAQQAVDQAEQQYKTAKDQLAQQSQSQRAAEEAAIRAKSKSGAR